MPPLECPGVELPEKHEAAIMKFVSDVRCGKVEGSERVALATVDLLELVISDMEDASASQLVSTVRAVGRVVSSGLPRALSAANAVRRLLKAIRDDHDHHHTQSSEGANAGESLQRLVSAAGAGTGRRGTLAGAGAPGLRDGLREHLAELRLELESSAALITAEAARHAHADGLLVALGCGALAERVLRAAAARRARLLMLEGHDVAESHSMAARLAAGGAAVTVAPHAAALALMPRVNKVVLEVEAVLPGGAALAARGARAVAAAAKHCSVPVVAVSPLSRLCPLHACDLAHLTAPAPPSAQQACGATEVSPGFDYIPPEYVTLFITNLGGNSPSYMYRLLSELYDPRDHHM